jgi:uncharacterized protein
LNVLLSGVAAVVALVFLSRWAVHRAYRAPRVREHGTPADLGLSYRAQRIATTRGKCLFAWFVPAASNVGKVPGVVVLHGWGGNAEDMLVFAFVLHRANFAVLLLDARNHGQSEGDGFSSLPRFAEDLERGFDWLRHEPGVDPARVILLGHSVGAAAALLVAARRPEPVAVVSIAAFAHPVDLMRRQMRAHYIPYWPVGWLVLRYVERTIGARFHAIAPCNTIGAVDCPILLIHGEADDRVPPSDALRIYASRRDDRTELLLMQATGHDSRDAVLEHAHALVWFLRRSVSLTGIDKSGVNGSALTLPEPRAAELRPR